MKAYIYHRCSVATAYRIAYSGQMWSKDGCEQANFNWDHFGGNNSEIQCEVTLEFEWSGKIKRDLLSMDDDVNVLQEIKPAGPNKHPWALVLLPGTDKGLNLVGVSYPNLKEDEDLEHNRYLLAQVLLKLEEKPSVIVPTARERVDTRCPRPQTTWDKIYGVFCKEFTAWLRKNFPMILSKPAWIRRITPSHIGKTKSKDLENIEAIDD